MKNIISLIAFIFILLCEITSISHSQVLPFHNYTVKDGLISNSINSLFQDSRGFIWIGTNDGISVFDGKSFMNYTTGDGLANNFIHDMIEDHNTPGTIWIATEGGVSKFADGKFTNFTLGLKPWAQRVHTIMQDHSGVIWCGTDSSAMRIVHDTIMPPFQTTLNIQNIESIVETGDSLIWFAHHSGVVSFLERTNEFRPLFDNGSQEISVGAMTVDHEGVLWIVRSDGTILKVENRMIVDRTLSACGGSTFVESDRHGRLWFGSYAGLFKLEKAKFGREVIMHIGTENGLIENRLRAGLVDRENNLWIGGNGKGVAKLASMSIYDIPLPARPTGGLLNSLAASDNDNHLWLAWYNELWELWEDSSGSWKKYRHVSDQDGPIEYPMSVGFSQEGMLCVGFALRGLRCYRVNHNYGSHSDLQLLRSMRPGIELPKGTSLYFTFDNRGHIWYSIGGIGVVLLDPGRKNPIVRIFGEHEGVPVNYVTVIQQDIQGNVWCGSYADGLYKLNVEDISWGIFHKYRAGIHDNRIRSLAVDHTGSLWVGTRADGISVVSKDGSKAYSVVDGLFSNTIQSLHEDPTGRMWIGTPSGLQYFDIDSVGSSERFPFHKSSELIGSCAFTSGTMPNGMDWFASLDGVTLYDILGEHEEHIPPPVYISQVKVGDVDISGKLGVALGHDKDNWTFDFIGISFRDEKAIRYRYRLLGADKDWRLPTGQNSVTYAFLQPGKYTFEVKAINLDGIESTSPASFPFTITPPYWQRWWFYLLVTIAVGSTLVALYRYRVGRILELEHMRIRIASDLHDDVGSTLTKISLQSDLLQSGASSPEAASTLQHISAMSRELTTTMSDIVWSIDARNDTMGNLVDRMRDFASSMIAAKQIDLSIMPEGLQMEKKLPTVVRQHLYLIFKEALTNSVKYAEASQIAVRLKNADGQFQMTIADNGKGVGALSKRTGHGFKNMKMRTDAIGGTFEVVQNDGTKIIVTTKPL